MKYRLLKDKIDHLSWYMKFDDAPENVIECMGFSAEMLTYGGRKEYIDVLPDIVEEYKPKGIIMFEDLDQEILEPKSEDFFFAHDKKAVRMPSGVWEVWERAHFVHVIRAWVEPI